MLFPSQFLPSLVPFPSFLVISDSLDRLAVPPTVNDLTLPLYIDIEDSSNSIAVVETETIEEGVGEGFELRFTFSWLERLVVIGTKQLDKENAGEVEWVEVVIERASSLLANLSGEGCSSSKLSSNAMTCTDGIDAATGEVTQIFRLPFVHKSSTAKTEESPYIDLRIRDTTLIGHSTGHRTWGAAPLLSQLMAQDVDHFFPTNAASEGSRLRVLELGAGTGLVGVLAAKLLEASGRDFSMELTDWQPIILDNLRHNLALNNLDSRTTVEKLDWSTCLDRRVRVERFDIIFGADLVYDLTHVALLHASVSSLLALPTLSTCPTFHLVLPVRSTHEFEMEIFDSAFPRPEASTAEFVGSMHPMFGVTSKWVDCRLVSKKRREMIGADGFKNKASRYIVYEIVWQALSDIPSANGLHLVS